MNTGVVAPCCTSKGAWWLLDELADKLALASGALGALRGADEGTRHVGGHVDSGSWSSGRIDLGVGSPSRSVDGWVGLEASGGLRHSRPR